jgi:hypothetical protein
LKERTLNSPLVAAAATEEARAARLTKRESMLISERSQSVICFGCLLRSRNEKVSTLIPITTRVERREVSSEMTAKTSVKTITTGRHTKSRVLQDFPLDSCREVGFWRTSLSLICRRSSPRTAPTDTCRYSREIRRRQNERASTIPINWSAVLSCLSDERARFRYNF